MTGFNESQTVGVKLASAPDTKQAVSSFSGNVSFVSGIVLM
jgi:hypothetical protein